MHRERSSSQLCDPFVLWFPKLIYFRSHYEVEIDPVVKVANQKKPKALLRAVWEQLVLDQKEHHEWGASFAVSAYDGRKNAFTPTLRGGVRT